MSALTARRFIRIAPSCPATISWRDVRGLSGVNGRRDPGRREGGGVNQADCQWVSKLCGFADNVIVGFCMKL